MKYFNIEIDDNSIINKFSKLLRMNKIKYETSDLDGHGKHFEIYCDEKTAKVLDDALDVMFNIQNNSLYEVANVKESKMSELTLETDTEEGNEEEVNTYQLLLKQYKNKKRFYDKQKQSGEYKDFIEDLKHKGISYDIYVNKKSNGCTVFYG